MGRPPAGPLRSFFQCQLVLHRDSRRHGCVQKDDLAMRQIKAGLLRCRDVALNFRSPKAAESSKMSAVHAALDKLLEE
jgi:hypothetical protein